MPGQTTAQPTGQPTGQATGQPAGTPRGDTRSRMQQVALELFAEQGYEKTSLREIAERLGVSKAALYYHFKSKEDIVHSFTDDHFARLDDLIEWGRTQPADEATRREILDRYASIVMAGHEVFAFLERNRAAVEGLHSGKEERFARFRGRLDQMVELLAGPNAPLRARVRATSAIFAVGATCMFYAQSSDDDLTGLHQIILEAATDLIGG